MSEPADECQTHGGYHSRLWSAAETPDTPERPPATLPDASALTAAAQAAAQSAATQPAAAGAAATAQAQTLLDQTITYIKENKVELAEKSLTQLEALKPRLPVEYHSKIDGVRKASNAARTGHGLKLENLLPGRSRRTTPQPQMMTTRMENQGWQQHCFVPSSVLHPRS